MEKAFRANMSVSFGCNDEAGKLMLTQKRHLFQSRFFSALPAPVPRYFDGVTLKR